MMDNYEKKYNEAMLRADEAVQKGCLDKNIFDIIFPPEESEDERMLKKLIEGFKIYIRDIRYFNDIDVLDILNFLEKQKNKKYEMIQWTGDNLKEVFKFTGKSPMFEKWFNSWEQYEEYVHSHENIFKLFNEDGSHYEVPVGAWIVKTPDGYNTPSRFRFIQKPAEWSEEDEK